MLQEQAETLAIIVLKFGLSLEEARNITGYELEALEAVWKEMNKTK